MNHIVDEYYSKHEYPPWYKEKTEQIIISQDKLYNFKVNNYSLQSSYNEEE